MSSNCLFCRIIAGEIPGTFVHRDDDVVVIEDADPRAPRHLLVMPVKHAANLSEFLNSATGEMVAKLFGTVAQVGREQGNGDFRTVVNSGAQAGQTVEHLHVHVLAGRRMQWPPG